MSCEQAKFLVNSEKVDYSTNIGSHHVGESMVEQKDTDIICTSSTLSITFHFELSIEDLILDWAANILLEQSFCFFYLNKHVI